MTKSRSAQAAQPSHYRNLSPTTVAKLSERATRIKAALQRSLVEVGRELTEAKKVLRHGQFTDWVERETGMSARTAQLIMGAYRLCLKNENFSVLGRSALFLLGSSDLPAATLAAIDGRIAAGDVPDYMDVRTIVRNQPRPDVVKLAVTMSEPLKKAQVVDLSIHRALAAAAARDTPERRERWERIEQFHNDIDVADIAAMLDNILDAGQIFRLVTMLRKTVPDTTLDALADALERL